MIESTNLTDCGYYELERISTKLRIRNSGANKEEHYDF